MATIALTSAPSSQRVLGEGAVDLQDVHREPAQVGSDE